MTAMRSLPFIFFSALFVHSAHAQWVIEESDTTANLSGIHNVGDGIAWASGTQGTILRTTDEGKTWQRCTTPPNAERLDFRGIQAFDQNTAIVMSSGPGAQSRIYKTTDGCLTWSLVFANPDAPDGSFKGIQFIDADGRDRGRIGHLIGDPVSGKFVEFGTYDYGQTWSRIEG